ncbi:MAG TPA: tetraacyldisaccharide 4'-kinase [Sulfuricurvum sp.]|nr:tetraacyldisaccharide 4'-kinase [Sulfuricurvum sp.]
MKRRLNTWGERFFYAPNFFQKLLSYLLWPLSVLYCFVMQFRFRRITPHGQGIAVVSVGNLTVGGSGKTPLVTALAQRQRNPGIVLRGYGRKSSGLQMVSDGKRILCDVLTSGDEAMIYALKVPHAVVVVSEDRDAGIAAAKEAGCDCVFLDDGYGKHHIKKYDIVIEVDTPNRFCLPAGPYRERLWPGKQVKLVKEGREFERHVSVKDAAQRMALVTAIARPQRLDRYLPPVVSKHYFPDHHFFSKTELQTILAQSGAEKLLVTYKDYVKIRSFNLPLALLDLDLELDPVLSNAVEHYIRSCDEN